MLGLEPERQLVEASTGGRIAVEGRFEVVGLFDVARRGVETDVDLDCLACFNAGRGALGGADTDQALAVFDGDTAAPAVAVDGDRHQRPRLGTERLHDLIGDFDGGGIAGGDDDGAELHGSPHCVRMKCTAAAP